MSCSWGNYDRTKLEVSPCGRFLQAIAKPTNSPTANRKPQTVGEANASAVRAFAAGLQNGNQVSEARSGEAVGPLASNAGFYTEGKSDRAKSIRAYVSARNAVRAPKDLGEGQGAEDQDSAREQPSSSVAPTPAKSDRYQRMLAASKAINRQGRRL